MKKFGDRREKEIAIFLMGNEASHERAGRPSDQLTDCSAQTMAGQIHLRRNEESFEQNRRHSVR